MTTSYSDLKDIEVTCIKKSEMKCNVQGEIETKAKFPRLGQIFFITFFLFKSLSHSFLFSPIFLDPGSLYNSTCESKAENSVL